MKLKRFMGVLTLGLLGIMLPFTNTYADEAPQALGLEVSPLFNSALQDKDNLGYIREPIQPDTDSKFSFRIVNPTYKEMKVGWSATGASTTQTGVIYNTDLKDAVDKEYDFAQYVKEKKGTYVLAPKEEKVVSITANVPQLTGQILGGVHFWDAGFEDDAKDQKGQVGLTYKIEYVQVVLLTGTNPKDVPSDIQILGVVPTVNAGGLNLDLSIKNNAPKIDGEYTYKWNVQGLKKGTKSEPNGKKYFNGVIPALKYAPKSTMHADLKWTNDAIKSGDYVLELTDKDGKHLKNVKFTIKNDTIDKVKETADSDKIESNIPWWVYLVIAVLVIFILFFIFFMLKRDKDKKEASEKEIARLVAEQVAKETKSDFPDTK